MDTRSLDYSSYADLEASKSCQGAVTCIAEG